jgi:quinol monooxygenase YgiN
VSTKCVLLLRYKLKPGVSQQFRKLLKDVLEECIKEPAFLTYTLHTYPDRPDEVMLYEVWAGTRERFRQEEMKKPYRPSWKSRDSTSSMWMWTGASLLRSGQPRHKSGVGC